MMYLWYRDRNGTWRHSCDSMMVQIVLAKKRTIVSRKEMSEDLRSLFHVCGLVTSYVPRVLVLVGFFIS